MNNPVKILNYATIVTNYVTLYTEIPHDFVVGDTIYINGGYYDNTEKIVDTFIEYVASGSVNNDIFSYINGYRIVSTHIVESGKYAFTIDFLTSPSTLVYPYGTTSNPFGFLSDEYNDSAEPDKLAYNNRLNNLEHSEIYAYKKGVFNSGGVFTHIEDHMIGIRDNNYQYSNVSIENRYDVNNNPELTLQIQRCCVQCGNLINVIFGDYGLIGSSDPNEIYRNVLKIREHLDPNDLVNPNTFSLILPTKNTYYPISRSGNILLDGCYTICANLYNPKGVYDLFGGSIFDSVIGNNGLYNGKSTIKLLDTNSIGSELQIQRTKTYSISPEENSIDRVFIIGGELLVYKKINKPKISGWDFDDTTNKLIINIEVPTIDLFKCNLEIDENLFKYKIDGLTIKTHEVLDLTGDHIILQNVNNLNECSILDYTINQDSSISQIKLIVNNIPNNPIDIIVDPIDPFIKLYTPSESFVNAYIYSTNSLDIYYDPITDPGLDNNNMDNNSFVGGHYKYVNITTFKSFGSEHSNVYIYDTVKFDYNHIKVETDPSLPTYNTVNWTYFNNNDKALYVYNITNSVLVSPTPHTLKIFNVKISDSLIIDSFVYNCDITNTRVMNSLWDMCSISDSVNSNESIMYGSFDINDLNSFYESKPLIKSYFDNATSRRSSSIPFYEKYISSVYPNLRNSSEHKNRNYTMAKTSTGLNEIISNPVTVVSNQYLNDNYDGDIPLGIYRGGTYNSLINYNYVELPVIKYNPSLPVKYKFGTVNNNYNIYTSAVYTNNTSLSVRERLTVYSLNQSLNGESKTEYFKKGVDTIIPFTSGDYSYFDSTPGLSAVHPAQNTPIAVVPPPTVVPTELIPYKPLDKFIKTGIEIRGIDVGNKAEMYATNIIENDLYWYNISSLGIDVNYFNPINVESLTIDNNIVDKIIFSGYGGLFSEIPNNTTVKDISIGLNKIQVIFNNDIFEGLDNTKKPTVMNNLYEVERIYVYDISDITVSDQLNGITILTRSSVKNEFSLMKRYTLGSTIPGIEHFGNSVDITDNNGDILNFDFEDGKTYIVFFDIWVTPSHVVPAMVESNSYNDPNNLYNTLEKTNISGSYSRFVRVGVTVKGSIEPQYLAAKDDLDNLNSVLTNDDEKIIIN